MNPIRSFIIERYVEVIMKEIPKIKPEQINDMAAFLGLEDGFEQIYKTTNLREIDGFLKLRVMSDNNRLFTINRLMRAYDVTKDLKGLVDCLKTIFTNVRNKKDETTYSKYDPLKIFLNGILRKLEKEDVIDALILVNLPGSHIFYYMVDEKQLEYMIIRTLPSLIMGFVEPLPLIKFMNQYLPKFNKNELADLLLGRLSELLQDINEMDELRHLKFSSTEHLIRLPIEKRMSQRIMARFRNNDSIAELLSGLQDIENYEEGIKQIRIEERIFIDEFTKIKDLKTVLDEYEKYSHLTLGCYSYIKRHITEHARNLVENIEPINPPQWFFTYIKEPDLIPNFLNKAFIIKAEEILNR
jgi:hypothetical protein